MPPRERKRAVSALTALLRRHAAPGAVLCLSGLHFGTEALWAAGPWSVSAGWLLNLAPVPILASAVKGGP